MRSIYFRLKPHLSRFTQIAVASFGSEKKERCGIYSAGFSRITYNVLIWINGILNPEQQKKEKRNDEWMNTVISYDSINLRNDYYVPSMPIGG